MNYMADLIRDCSKARPTTFNQISFPIFQEIELKIKNKNLNLRKKARSRIFDRQKLSKPEQTKEENGLQTKKQTILYNKIQRQQFNYVQLYKDPRSPKQTLLSNLPLELDKLDDKDQDMTFQIYLMMKKKKSIFKVEQVRRKLRAKEGNRRINLKECECCGSIGKHKCKHIICQKKCEKYARKLQKQEVHYDTQEPNRMVALAEQMIEGEAIQGSEMPRIEIKINKQKEEEEEIVMPQIDKIQGEEEIKKEEQQIFDELEMEEEAELPAVRQTQRISQNQSNSQVSENRKDKQEINQVPKIKLQHNGEEHLQMLHQQILVNLPKQESQNHAVYQ